MKTQHATTSRNEKWPTKRAREIRDVGGHSFLLDPIKADQLTRERLRSIERSLAERSNRLEAGSEQEEHVRVLHLSLAQVRQAKRLAGGSSIGSDRPARRAGQRVSTPARG